MAWRSFYEEAKQRLTSAGLPSPEVDARRLVEEASGNEGADFVTGLDDLATQRGVVKFDAMMARRLAGEPLQYVLGRWGFRQLDLAVDRRALIPRPETEFVTGLGLDELERQAADRGDSLLQAVDLGTGSGAIGLSIAFERPDVQVICSDSQADALDLARANLAGLGRVGVRVLMSEGSWFDALEPGQRSSFHLVISNPPYVERDADLPGEVADWEPVTALFSDDDGFADAAHLIEGAVEWLRPGGALVLELGATQLDRACELATAIGYQDVVAHDDYVGRPRALVARYVTR